MANFKDTFRTTVSGVLNSKTNEDLGKAFESISTTIKDGSSRSQIVSYLTMLFQKEPSDKLSDDMKERIYGIIPYWADFFIARREAESAENDKKREKLLEKQNSAWEAFASYKFFEVKEIAPASEATEATDEDKKPAVVEEKTTTPAVRKVAPATTRKRRSCSRNRKGCHKQPERVRIVVVKSQGKKVEVPEEVKPTEETKTEPKSVVDIITGRKPKAPKSDMVVEKPAKNDSKKSSGKFIKIAALILGVFVLVGVVLGAVNAYTKNNNNNQSVAEESGYGRRIFSSTIINNGEFKIRIDTAAQADCEFKLYDLQYADWKEAKDSDGKDVIYTEIPGTNGSRIRICCPPGRAYGTANELNNCTVVVKNGISSVVQNDYELIFDNNDYKSSSK
jgi:hypothetical protein